MNRKQLSVRWNQPTGELGLPVDLVGVGPATHLIH
jgi:hypothetical protein